MIRRLFFFFGTIVMLLTACENNDSFSTDPSYRLTFSVDTVRIDTLFSDVPSCTKTFWVYNNSSDGVRIRSVRLDRGNQSGFRVNVDGTFLNPVAIDLEVRKGDSIRVFVEVTTRENYQSDPQLVEDNLLFMLESGVEQRINLRTYSWDAKSMRDVVVSSDQTIEEEKPLIIYGKGITVNEGATLTIRNTTLYFHDGAGIDVKGRLVVENVLMRGDRLDHMFDYLPYDRVSGQWRGITVKAKSKGIEMIDCELRNACTALSCDTTTIELTNTVIHNCKGYGLTALDSEVKLTSCLISNTLNDCLYLRGCLADVNQCTLAQFYPFSANRGAAFRFVNTEQPLLLTCSNTVVTGYADDVLFDDSDKEKAKELMSYTFKNCLLRTPPVESSEALQDIIWEKSTDEIQGSKHFVTFDDVKFIYDFHLKEESPAYTAKMGWPGYPEEPSTEQ
jgi:hypothetical protein